MRLLIAMLSSQQAGAVCDQLFQIGTEWDIVLAADGVDALRFLSNESFDLLLLHACLPRLDGLHVLSALGRLALICPPRVLFLCEPELTDRAGLHIDCRAPLCALPQQLCMLLIVLAKKPLPMLAAANEKRVLLAAEDFLDAISLRRDLKGRMYAAWLIRRLIPSPLQEEESMGALYAACAKVYHTTPGAVERCLRVAVESAFTQGSIQGIESFFGATIDPERGKPTNHAFLLQAVQQLRGRLYSLAGERSPKSSEMHQSPAAPTMV